VSIRTGFGRSRRACPALEASRVRPLRILFASGGWAGEVVGGGYKIATELAVHMASGGHDVHYLAPSPATDVAPVIFRDGVTVWRYPAPRHPHPTLATSSST